MRREGQGLVMRLRRFTDYALRVLIYAAERPGQWLPIPQIAAAHAISENHLVKVVHQLGRLGYLDTRRGRGGGVRLARPPQDIRLGEVVRRVEGDDPMVDCADCVLAVRGCGLDGALQRGLQAFYAALDRQSLQDLCVPVATPGG